MGLVFAVNELCRDSRFVTVAPHTSLQHILHPKFTADLVQRLRTGLVVHYGGPSNHSEALWVQASKLGDHFFSQAVAEIVLPNVSREVLDGKNRRHKS